MIKHHVPLHLLEKIARTLILLFINATGDTLSPEVWRVYDSSAQERERLRVRMFFHFSITREDEKERHNGQHPSPCGPVICILITLTKSFKQSVVKTLIHAVKAAV